MNLNLYQGLYNFYSNKLPNSIFADFHQSSQFKVLHWVVASLVGCCLHAGHSSDVTLAFEDAQDISPFSGEETDDANNTDDTDCTDDTDETDETNDTNGTDDTGDTDNTDDTDYTDDTDDTD